VDIRDLHGQPVILFERDQATRKLIDRIFKRHAVAVKPVMEQDNIETMKRGIEANIGLSILPEPSVVQELRAGTLVGRPFRGKPLYRPVGIVYRKGKVFSEPVKRLLDLLREPPGRLGDEPPITVVARPAEPL